MRSVPFVLPQPAQIEEITRLISKCFVEFNASVNAHPDVIVDEFGDPNMDNNLRILNGYVAVDCFVTTLVLLRCVVAIAFTANGETFGCTTKESQHQSPTLVRLILSPSAVDEEESRSTMLALLCVSCYSCRAVSNGPLFPNSVYIEGVHSSKRSV